MDGLLAPLPRLLASYAGHGAQQHRLLWAYDARLADVVRTTREPMVGQMRLAWWDEVLTDDTQIKGKGDPLVDALRANPGFLARRPGMLAMIDGWEVLLDALPLEEAALRTYAEGRGGGLFQAMEPDAHPKAGALWVLWDLSGHIGDPVTAQRAVDLAQQYLAAPRARSKPLRLATALARHDIARGRSAPSTLTPGLYARLLRIALLAH